MSEAPLQVVATGEMAPVEFERPHSSKPRTALLQGPRMALFLMSEVALCCLSVEPHGERPRSAAWSMAQAARGSKPVSNLSKGGRDGRDGARGV